MAMAISERAEFDKAIERLKEAFDRIEKLEAQNPERRKPGRPPNNARVEGDDATQ